jgi:hypothetical protein
LIKRIYLKMNVSRSTAVSPTKSDKGSRRSFGYGSPQAKKVSSPLSGYTAKKTFTATSFFKVNKTASTSIRPSIAANGGPHSNDIAILHESRIFKNLVAKADAKAENKQIKRNPILQDGDEPCHEFKSSIRRLVSADRMSTCADETFSRSKKTGEYNHVFNPRSLEPKPEGIKAFSQLPSESRDEYSKAVRKQVRGKSEVRRNPITEGDETSQVARRVLKPVEETSEHQKKYNDKKCFLPSERGTSSRGQVFRESNITIVGSDLTRGSKTDRLIPSPRPMTEVEEKMRGFIRGVLEYDNAPEYRDVDVTTKCTTVKFSDLLKTQDATRIFARKKTLNY